MEFVHNILYNYNKKQKKEMLKNEQIFILDKIIKRSIEIVKTQRSKGIKYTEAKTIHEVCSGEKTIYKIAKLLSDYTVTPISLEEVLEDISRGSPNDELEISPSA
jgi:hypothetical protein